MSVLKIKTKKFTWYHFHHLKEDDVKFLRRNFDFHPLDYTYLVSDMPIAKVNTYDDYVFAVFQVPVVSKETGLIDGIDMQFFLSDRILITVSEVPIVAVENFVRKINKSREKINDTLGRGPAFVMQALLTDVFQGTFNFVSEFSIKAKQLERELQKRYEKRTTIELGLLRRNVLYLRHVLSPQRKMIEKMFSEKHSYLQKDLKPYFNNIADSMDTIWLACDNLKTIIDGLFDVNESLLSHRMNKIITLLTIISATFMAPSLIAGFYGMNVPWLPYFESPYFVSFLYFCSLGILMIAVHFVLKRRWQ